ncbi:MAG: YecA family protein [Rubrivivax sp.]|nr:YecA family protein [Rubrivivax sp.]
MPAPTPTPATAPAAPLNDADIERLQQLLDAVPPPLEALDVMALDGYLCGVILQPRAVAASRWLPGVTDVDGRPLPAGFDAAELHKLARRRHAELERAITRRDWFDPWIFDVEDDGSPSDALLPWVAGFAAAQDLYPDLMAIDDPALIEPLALLYLHVPREDLEDADALLEVIDTIEPPTALTEAVQDLVRAVMLIADVSRPRPAPGRTDAPKAGTRGGKPPSGSGRGRR